MLFSRKKITVVLLVAAVCTALLALYACRSKSAIEAAQTPSATLLGGDKTISNVAAELKKVGLSNTDIFKEWAMDFAEAAGKNAGLQDTWLPTDAPEYDIAKCMEGWEKAHDFSDADCRMTAFLLLEGLLSFDSVEEAYNGTYLMFDLEAMDSVDRYELLRKRRAEFTTLFGDNQVIEGEPYEAFTQLWRRHGISLSSEKASLLSLVIYDPSLRTTFVGHTGVLLDFDDYLLFVEKIAFEQPYQVTKVKNTDELLHMLSIRGEYFGGEDEPGAYVYLNDKYLGELQRP